MGRGAFHKIVLIGTLPLSQGLILVAAGACMVAVAVTEPSLLLKCATAPRNWTETIMSNAEHIYGIAHE